MSSDSGEYYTNDEDDEVISSSVSVRSSLSLRSSRHSGRGINPDSNSGVIIDETESEDESVRPSKAKPKQRRRPLVIASDSEEEDELDSRALSPSTRMSITGVRPQDLSDDSSEIDYSDEEASAGTAEETYNEDVERKEAAAARNRQSIDGGGDGDGGGLSPRYSTQFMGNIEETLHSTVSTANMLEVSLDNSSSSDVLELSNKESPIEISSTDDESSFNKENISAPPLASRSYSPRSNARAPVVNSTKSLMQPTIQRAFKQSTSPIAPRRSLIKSEAQKVVTQEYHQEEMSKLMEMRAQKNDAEKLYEIVAKKLPDKGSQIRKRIDALGREIELKTKLISSLKVEQRSVPAIKATTAMKAHRKSDNDTTDWEDLSAAVNSIQPKYTGAQGMATFNTQKALTLESLKDLHGSLKGCPAEDVLADDPEGLKITLMDHQKHALAWMSWRENQTPRGGILADDMGLGKTLTMISSVLACKNRQESRDGRHVDSDSDEENDTKRKSTGGWNSKGRKDTHRGGTLVVCPASLLRQWEAEVESKVNRHRLTVCVHHGNNRETKAKHLRTYDIVVTTYNIVGREHKESSALFGVKWRRIILDEAHVVRNHKALTSIAVSDLRGKFRWALTGTPIQNKELDIYALLKFLRCSPFDDLNTWKKWIDNKSAGGQNRLNLLMKSIMLRRTKAQLQQEGKLNSLPGKDLRMIEISLDKDEMNVYQTVMTYSRTLFAQFLFQRAEKDSDSNFISDANKPTYNQIKDPNGAYYKLHEKFAKMAGNKKEVKSHEILVLLLRLRQICCHPGLIDSMLEGEEAKSMDADGSDGESPEIDLLAQLNKLAITDTSTSPRRSSRDSGSSRGVTEDDDGPPLHGDEARIAKASKNVLKRSNPVFNMKRPSTKMLKVMEILKSSILKDNNDKAIIVSQWTSVLEILRNHLENDKLSTLSLNGSIPVKNRQEIVNQFNDQHNQKRILLLSLTAGGVGLNLVGANHLLLLDLHWNPQLEAQAQDRIYRVGQKKDVMIYKFVCLDTVEQRILALQQHKLELANGVLTGSGVSSKLTIDDLKGLFGI
ncbi:transcription termination factor 2 [Drosophila miranda]|uniref:transcription termination factor 2 n=1 Tax=Drosophila miranda TaxID=7229 RepID=UPI0007E7D78A|nr:transcription termination factor 2 [Drosophila miranda]